MRAAVESRAAGEEAVAVADLDDVVGGSARGDYRARAGRVPEVDVVLRVEGDDAASRRSARGLDADAVAQRHAEQPVGIGLAQVVLADEGQLRDVGEALDVLGLHAVVVHLFAVVGRVLVGVLHRADEALGLPFRDLLARGALDLGLEVVLFLHVLSIPSVNILLKF